METRAKDGRRLPKGKAAGCGYNGVNPAKLKSPRRELYFQSWTPEELEKRIEEYFDEQERQEKPPTVSGLGWWIGIDRNHLLQYAKSEDPERQRWSGPIRAAYRRIEGYLESQLCKQTGQVAGVQFVLKNNFGWQDRQEIELSAHRVESLSDEELRAEIQRLQLPGGGPGEGE